MIDNKDVTKIFILILTLFFSFQDLILLLKNLQIWEALCKASHAKKSKSEKKNIELDIGVRIHEPIYDSWLGLPIVDKPHRWVRHLVKF